MNRRRIPPSNRIVRYTLLERVVHWIAGIAYLYLLLTGLAFYSPALFWLTTLFGGGVTARAWHPIVGLLFTLDVIWMYRMWQGDMRTTKADQAWLKKVRHYIRNEDDKVPPVGRFNPGQKQLFWLMFYGAILLFLSGAILWFPEFVPWNLQVVKFVAVLVHVIVALLTIGGFMVHVYMGIAIVHGGFEAITRGEVSEPWAKAHHHLWVDEMTKDSATQK